MPWANTTRPTGWRSTCSIRSVITGRPKPACSIPPAVPGHSSWPRSGAGGKTYSSRSAVMPTLAVTRNFPPLPSSASTCIRWPWPRRGRTISWRSRTSWDRTRRSTCRSSRAMPSSTSRRTRPPLISSSAIRPGLPGTTCPAIIARPRSRTGSVTACSRFPATRRGMAAARRTCRCSCSTRPPIAIWRPPAGWAW